MDWEKRIHGWPRNGSSNISHSDPFYNSSPQPSDFHPHLLSPLSLYITPWNLHSLPLAPLFLPRLRYPCSLLRFILPAFLSHQRNARPTGSSYSNWMADNGDVPHVLAVDDNLVDRKLLEKLLRNSSCKVTTAENGARALELLGLATDEHSVKKGTRSKVNLVITDYCMPGMTGYDLLKKIKESSMMKEVPVVIVSSENVPTRINKCLEEGAQMFILKPLKQSDVNILTCQLMNLEG